MIAPPARIRQIVAITSLGFGLMTAAASGNAADTKSGNPLTSAKIKIAAARPFLIDQTEVTVRRYRAFAATTGVTTMAERQGGGMEYSTGWQQRPGWTWQTPYGEPAAPDEPAAHVTQPEAVAFCRHANGRLPTLDEWRVAAYTETRSTPTGGLRSGQTYAYPVGATPEGMNTSGNRHQLAGTTKQGVNGLYDMGGNLWEWLAERQGDQALTIGGSWWYPPAMTQPSGAQFKPADFAAIYIGFRCVYDE